MNIGLPFGIFGTNDFIEYWSAFQLFILQNNPYDPEKLLKLQQSIGWADSTPLMMWNPPWVLLLLAPVLLLPFSQAALVWLICSLGLVIWSIYMILDLLSPGDVTFKRILWGCVGAATFFPMWTSLRVGQLGVLLGWALCGALWAIERRKPLMAGVCMSLWTLKVHLFLPVVVYLIFRSLRDRFLWIYFGYGTVLLLLSVGVTELWHPGAMSEWLGAFEGAKVFNQLSHVHGTASQVVLVEQWIAASLTGAVRMLLAEGGLTPAWPMWIVPLVGISIVGLIAIRTPSDSSYVNGVTFASLVAVAFAPFGWVFDFSILLTVYLLTLFGFNWVLGDTTGKSAGIGVGSVSYKMTRHMSMLSSLQLFKDSKAAILAGLFLISQCLAWILSASFNEHQHYIWLPLVMLGGVTWRSLSKGDVE